MSRFTHPKVTLSNGARVVNFSSPHEFRFTDGSVLAACPPDMTNALKMEPVEVEYLHPQVSGVHDIALDFRMTDVVFDALVCLYANPEIDIILIPFPLMTVIKNVRLGGGAGMSTGKCRVCRVADRVTKVIHHDKFCI